MRLVHISLHRVEANDARPLAETFHKHGWKLVRYNPLMSKGVPTAVGKVSFTDGRLTFLNPKLCPADMHGLLYDARNVHTGTYTSHKAKKESPHADWSEGDTILDIMSIV